MNKFLKELEDRGMLHSVTPTLEKKLDEADSSGTPFVGYVGFDPTAKSLHVGNLVAIMLLKHLQLHGHKPIALVGGATGMIGDPSGKKDERKFLSEEVLKENQIAIEKQLTKFLDFFGDNGAVVVNNYDWISSLSIIDFFRTVGKNSSVKVMMNRDSVKNRMEDENAHISYTEFSYQLIQAYDFVHLNTNYNCSLQMGGSDQWGNMMAGIDLTRRLNQNEVESLTCPLLTKSDGNKFGKSESGNVWLDPELTSPFEFFQFWNNQSDEDAAKLIKYFTLIPMDQINDMIDQHKNDPKIKYLQHKLAEQVTLLVHGRKGLNEALAAHDFLLNDGGLEKIEKMPWNQVKRIFATVPQTTIKRDDFSNSDIFDVLSNKSGNKIFSSKGDVRRTLLNNGLYINKQKIQSIEDAIPLIHDKIWIIQKGKKNYHILEVI